MQIEYNTNYRFEGHNTLVLTRFKFYFNREDHILLEQFPEDTFEMLLELSHHTFESCSDNFQHEYAGSPGSAHFLKFSLAKNNPREDPGPVAAPSWETEEYSITENMPGDNKLDPLKLIESIKSQATGVMKDAGITARRKISSVPSAPQYHAIEDIKYK